MSNIETQRGPLRIGIVGAGKMGMHHARAIRQVRDRVELVAVADPVEATAEAASKALGIPAFADLDAMLDAVDCDVIHICTAPSTHYDLARQAIERGCHVYIEKPVAPTVAEMRELTALAAARGRSICAGHQLLFEPPMLELRKWLPALGKIAHVESFFSFRTVRRAPGGRAPMRADQQLLDILPHPIYLLLDILHQAEPNGVTELRSLEVDPAGNVHALIRRGRVTGTLVVTLEGRPVESYLRVTGTNGAANADFVRGTVQRLIGPGSSGIDKVLNPYRTSWQLLTGTTVALARRLLKRQLSYPGLAELMEAFYVAIQQGTHPPTTPDSLVEGVAIWERVSEAFDQAAVEAAARLKPADSSRERVVLTGGTGFLGVATARRLLADGYSVRVLARRVPAPWERIEGVEYAAADLGGGVDPELLKGAVAVVHAAAETAGSWEEHQRNSIDATAHMLRAAAAAGVERFIHVSSMAVIGSHRGAVSETTPLESNPRGRGPYVWGKLESEKLATELAKELGIDLRVVRPGAIIDAEEYDPPGRLGKRVGPLFVAVGSRRGSFGTVDRQFAARVISWAIGHFEKVPPVVNLVDAELPTRGELVDRLRPANPDLKVVWLPRPVLGTLSLVAVAAQKVLRPSKPAIHVARVFADQALDRSVIREIARRIDRTEEAFATQPRMEQLPYAAASAGD